MKKNIALVDVDSKIPNIALMKLSAYHKLKGDNVELVMPAMAHDPYYDLIYASKIFTFTATPSLPTKTIWGGSGTHNIAKKLPVEIDSICPDYSLYDDMDYSMGYLTRGCSRRCQWCIVPEKEGDIVAYQSAAQFVRHDKVLLLDNNVLACEHGLVQIAELAQLGVKIDFNQGLDARLMDKPIAKLLAKCKWWKPVRLACDTAGGKAHLEKAVCQLRAAHVTPSKYGVYVLVTDDIEDSHDRIKFAESLGCTPFAQPFRDRAGTIPPLIARELASWCNLPAQRKTLTFQQYWNYRHAENID